MANASKIEWTEATWNPVTGCTRVSAGCDNCYAARMSKRLAAMGQQKYEGINGSGHFNGTVKLHYEALKEPLKVRKPTTFFVCSMSDLFHPSVPFDFIDRVWAVMALCPQHTFQVLTKRPERAAQYLNWGGQDTGNVREDFIEDAAGQWIDDPQHLPLDPLGGLMWPLRNVWLGTSVEDQPAADQRIPHLRQCPAAVRFLSCEPLLGSLYLTPWLNCLRGEASRGWVIVGGESGPGARPMDIEWLRSIIQQCNSANVPVFVKQLGKWISGSHEFSGWKGVIDRWLLEDGSGKQSILRAEYAPQYYDERPTNAVAWGLNDAKGGEMSEWPEDLRVRQMPEAEGFIKRTERGQ